MVPQRFSFARRKTSSSLSTGRPPAKAVCTALGCSRISVQGRLRTAAKSRLHVPGKVSRGQEGSHPQGFSLLATIRASLHSCGRGPATWAATQLLTPALFLSWGWQECHWSTQVVQCSSGRGYVARSEPHHDCSPNSGRNSAFTLG